MNENVEKVKDEIKKEIEQLQAKIAEKKQRTKEFIEDDDTYFATVVFNFSKEIELMYKQIETYRYVLALIDYHTT